MHRRILLATVAIFFCVGPSYSSNPTHSFPTSGFESAPVAVFAEQATAPQDTNNESVQEALETGYALERQRLWADALVHYESESRSHPDNSELRQRLQIVRIRFDLSRRYADNSFVSSARHLSVSQSMELFREVCLKIQSHYVEPPNWKSLVQRGNRNLEVALRDEEFIKTHRIKTDEREIIQFVRYLFKRTSEQDVPSLAAAQRLVRTLAEVGESELGISAPTAILEYICGATSSLDEYSTFLTAAQLDDVYSQIEGNFVGLGIELKASEGSLLITNVIPNGPADRSGIEVNDRIVAVDSKTMNDISTDKAADMLKGEQGSVVNVAVRKEDGSTRSLNVRRERVEVPSVEGVRLVDKAAGIGYLRLTSFQKTTSRDVDAALWSLHRQGMRSLIIDVRHNPGGLLTQSVEVADKFVMDGTIVATRGRSAREDFDYKAHRVGTWRVSLVVLIDEESASASEIFAGAIRDHRRGTIVGRRSYGKGSVQGIFPLRTARTGVRLTTAKFYSPSGKPISNLGVSPDVVVRDSAVSANRGKQDDPVLKAGIEVARQRLARRVP